MTLLKIALLVSLCACGSSESTSETEPSPPAPDATESIEPANGAPLDAQIAWSAREINASATHRVPARTPKSNRDLASRGTHSDCPPRAPAALRAQGTAQRRDSKRFESQWSPEPDSRSGPRRDRLQSVRDCRL